jgi:hypothetical protein
MPFSDVCNGSKSSKQEGVVKCATGIEKHHHKLQVEPVSFQWHLIVLEQSQFAVLFREHVVQ